MIKLKILIIFLCIFCLVLPVFAQDEGQSPKEDQNANYASGKIIQIVSEKDNKTLEDSFHTQQVVQRVKVLVINGKYRGKTVYVENQLTASPVYDINIKPGNRVVLNYDETPKGPDFYIADLERIPVLLILTGVFLSLLLLIGGKQGLRSVVSIAVTILLIFFVLVPAVMHKFPIIPVTIAITFITTFAAIFISAGINLKSLSAALGTVLSVMLAGIISFFTIKFAPLNGFNNQEAVMLWSSRPDLDFTGLLTAGVIIASLGAVMDIGMSIASCIAEFKAVNNKLTSRELFKSGLNVGKDIMGAMSNTLILAYIGGAFSLILMASDAPFIKLLNLNSIAAEVASALIGSIGIIFCVPVTALIAGYLIGKYDNKSGQPVEIQDKIVMTASQSHIDD